MKRKKFIFSLPYLFFILFIYYRPDDAKDDTPRFEKIFRRLDGDSDGMITPKEFKIGLKRLHYKDYKAWNMLMVRRLFDECDKNKDGLLSIKEFVVYILDRQLSDARKPSTNTGRERSESGGGGSSGKLSIRNPDRLGAGGDEEENDALNLSDDENDEVFRKKRALTDHELIRKINEVLMEIVPNEFPNNPQKHLEMIRSSVRRFFQRSDPEYKGFVSEERFRAFLRRSGLQDRLTANELRRFSDKLKKKGVGQYRNESMIDYERLIQQLLVVTESIPKSKAEIVFTRLQDAAISSANAGRSFLNLCSLIDLRLTGFITKEELMHTSKMMDNNMSAYDVEALCELLPNSAVSKDNMSIDYRALNSLLSTYSVREQFMRDLDYSNVNTSNSLNQSRNFGLNRNSSGALPAYATPGAVTNVVMDPIYGNSGIRNSNAFISTPLGHSINSPQRGYFNNQINAPNSSWDDFNRLNLNPNNMSAPGTPFSGSNMGAGNSGVYDKIIRSLAERIRHAIQEKNSASQYSNNYYPGTPMTPSSGNYNLRKRMENNDMNNSGTISIRTLQYLLEEIGIILTASDLQVISTFYGGKVAGDIPSDHIFYDSFCRLVENTPVLDRNEFTNPLVTADGSPVYFNHKVLMKYKEMKERGNDLYGLLEFYDVDRKGKVRIIFILSRGFYFLTPFFRSCRINSRK
jgi:Ca2+-binding EF-hand superfamily protein